MDLSGLNKNQLEAVQATQGPILVIAGAGTGKTTVLTQRIAYLISELGINPNRILAFTFTIKAAEEMRNRVNRIIPHSNASWIKTYHSTCLKILKEDIDKLEMGWDNNFSIIDEDDQISLVRQIMKDLNIQTKIQAKKFVKIVGEIKLDDISFDDFSYYELAQRFEVPEESDVMAAKTIYDTYQKRLQAADQLDYSDLINFVHLLFAKNKNVREKWQKSFDYVLVDEYGTMIGNVQMLAVYSANTNVCTLKTTTMMCKNLDAVITKDESQIKNKTTSKTTSDMQKESKDAWIDDFYTKTKTKTEIKLNKEEFSGTVCKEFGEPITTTESIKM